MGKGRFALVACVCLCHFVPFILMMFLFGAWVKVAEVVVAAVAIGAAPDAMFADAADICCC